MLAAAHILETVLVCFVAVGSGFLFRTLLLQYINDLLGILASLIQKRHILRKPDIGRCTGRIHDQCTGIASACGRIRIIIVVLLLGYFFPLLDCILYNHLVDLAQHFRRQALAEVHHERWVKGQMFIVIAGITTEVLQIRILLNLQSGFFVGITVLSLNDAGSQGQAQRLCHIALTIGEQPGIASLNIRPGYCLRLFDPAITFFQIHTYRLLEIRKTDLTVTVSIHSRPPSARFFAHFPLFPCPYYTTEAALCLDITVFFDYSVNII